MPKPQVSTIDRLIDTFDGWPIDTQERVLDQLELVHRLAKRRKPEAEAKVVLPGAQPVQTILDSQPEAEAIR